MPITISMKRHYRPTIHINKNMVAYTIIFIYTLIMFDRCLYFNINALTRTVNRIWEQAFAEFELSPSHAYLLRLVLTEPGLSPKQISIELKLEKSTITRFLDALQKKCLISRKKSNSGDAREQGIYPTIKAENIATQLEHKGEQLYSTMGKEIGKQDLIQLVKEIRKIDNTLG